jgi:hypothetical protein
MTLGGRWFVVFAASLFHQFKPYGVENAEGAGEPESEDPAEVPHEEAPPSIEVSAALDMLEPYSAAQDPQDPARVEQHDRQEDDRGEEHD